MAAHAFVAIDHLEEKKAKTNANVELLRARRNTNITETTDGTPLQAHTS